jgi:hypothetical protein
MGVQGPGGTWVACNTGRSVDSAAATRNPNPLSCNSRDFVQHQNTSQKQEQVLSSFKTDSQETQTYRLMTLLHTLFLKAMTPLSQTPARPSQLSVRQMLSNVTKILQLFCYILYQLCGYTHCSRIQSWWYRLLIEYSQCFNTVASQDSEQQQHSLHVLDTSSCQY